MKELKEKIKDYEDSNKIKINTDIAKWSFSEYIYWWLETQKKNTLKEGTYLDYQDLIKYYVEDFNEFDIGSKQIGQLNETLFQNHINALANCYSRATIVRIYAVITPSLKYAKKKKFIVEDIWEDYHIPSEDNVAHKKKEPIFLTKDDMYKLIIEAQRINKRGDSFGKIGEPTYGNNSFALLLIMGGAFRKGEALSLKWKNVSFKTREITIETSIRLIRNIEDNTSKYKLKETSPKNKDSNRTIPMSDVALLALKKLEEVYPNHKDEDYVCLNKNGSIIQERNLRRTLNSMLTRAGCSLT
jgi:integrase